MCFGAGLGITLFGIMYMFFHDGLVHHRFPVGPIAEVRGMSLTGSGGCGRRSVVKQRRSLADGQEEQPQYIVGTRFRAPLSLPVRRHSEQMPYMKRVMVAHQIHHSNKFGGVPFGMFLGPQVRQGSAHGAHATCYLWTLRAPP